MRCYPLTNGSIMYDLGQGSSLIRVDARVLAAHGSCDLDQLTLALQDTWGIAMLCAKPIKRTTTGGREIYYINEGADHLLTLLQQSGSRSWDNYDEFVGKLAETLLQDKGFSKAAVTSNLGGCWIEAHTYPLELYRPETWDDHGTLRYFPSRPKLDGLRLTAAGMLANKELI